MSIYYINQSDKEHTQKCVSDLSKSAIPPTQKCATTNNTTNKDTIERTNERPSPLPAGGQSPAALEYRTQAQKEVIENFKRTFGISKKGKYTPLSDEEFQNERQKQMKSLLLSK